MFGEKPKKTITPLVAGDHPENELSDFCDQDQIKEYQTIGRQTNLTFWIGKFDNAVQVMTMSRFRQQPRPNIWPLLKPLLFWRGDTYELTAKTKGSDRISA